MNPLDQLRDIHTPPAFSLFPLAPGWWFLLGMVITIIILLAILYRIRQRQQQHLQRVQQLKNRALACLDAHDMAPQKKAEALRLLLARLLQTRDLLDATRRKEAMELMQALHDLAFAPPRKSDADALPRTAVLQWFDALAAQGPVPRAVRNA